MRCMRGIEKKQDFIDAKNKFIKNFTKNCEEEDNCDWSEFKETFLNFSKYKCPICENNITKYDDIDHYRPKKAGYEFLRCCCDNYMIMCSDCNRSYKHISFPLDDNFIATSKSLINKEKPLLVNPRVDNVLEYFELHFIRSGEISLLELRPFHKLDKSSYKYRRAKKTIEIYGLGYCKENSKVDKCRINIFENHCEHLLDLAKAREKSKEAFLIELTKKPKRQEYGFVKFIAKKQFVLEINL